MARERKPARESSNSKNDSIAVDRFSHLPIDIIHHILTMIPPRDAARISTLSKAWRDIWSSFPISNFSEEDATDCGYDFFWEEDDEKIHTMKVMFMNFVDNSMKCRFKQDLSIQKFNLRMSFVDLESVTSSMVDQWVEMATKMNVRELGVSLVEYDFPLSVLESKTLHVLKIQSCKLYPYSDVKFCQLRKLFLKEGNADDDTIQYLISRCPLLEDLELDDCQHTQNIHVDGSFVHLNTVKLHNCYHLEKIVIEAPNLEKFWYSRQYKAVNSCEINFLACKFLKELTLQCDNKEIQDLISNLPCLEVLALHHCYYLETISFSNQKLKKLVLTKCKKLSIAEIDAPNLISVNYRDNKMPFYSVNSSKLRDVHLEVCLGKHGRIWLTKVQDFLGKFNHSKDLKFAIKHGAMQNLFVYEKWNGVVPLPNQLKDFKHTLIFSTTNLWHLMTEWYQQHAFYNLLILYSSNGVKFLREKLMGRALSLNYCLDCNADEFRCWWHYMSNTNRKFMKIHGRAGYRTYEFRVTDYWHNRNGFKINRTKEIGKIGYCRFDEDLELLKTYSALPTETYCFNLFGT